MTAVSVRNYYDGPELVERVTAAVTAAGLDPSRLELDDLAALDEFHALGRAATVALANLAAVRAGERVLDAGAGIGGPARVLASRFGARVTALDGTARFCRLAEYLNAATGLSADVKVVCADALQLPFPDSSFDVVWTQALTQNVADKLALFTELRRVLRPGGRLAVFEVLAGPGGPLHLPVPWADAPAHSHLLDADAMRRVTAAAGFEPRVWRRGAEVFADIADVATAEPAREVPSGLGLELLMPEHDRRMATVARNVAERRIDLLQGVLRPA
jgi:ubiquinone/menaquinone biosynthesis C-methylase UbiE